MTQITQILGATNFDEACRLVEAFTGENFMAGASQLFIIDWNVEMSPMIKLGWLVDFFNDYESHDGFDLILR